MHYEINILDDDNHDHELERSFNMNSSRNYNNNDKDELLHNLQLEMDALKVRLFKKEENENNDIIMKNNDNLHENFCDYEIKDTNNNDNHDFHISCLTTNTSFDNNNDDDYSKAATVSTPNSLCFIKDDNNDDDYSLQHDTNKLQHNNDLLLEIMEINLLIADIVCKLSSYSVEYHHHHATIATNKASSAALHDNSNKMIVPIVVDSKEIIQQEQIDIDIIISEIFLTHAINIQEDINSTNQQEDMSPLLSHCVLLDCDATTSTRKERFTINQIINDIFFSLATKSCEISYNNNICSNNNIVDFSNDLITSEQILLHALYCIENRNNIKKIIINQTIESYYINKNINNSRRERNDLLLLNEPFYDNHISKHGDYDYDDDNYPQEQILVECSNNNNSGRFGSVFNWFRRK